MNWLWTSPTLSWPQGVSLKQRSQSRWRLLHSRWTLIWKSYLLLGWRRLWKSLTSNGRFQNVKRKTNLEPNCKCFLTQMFNNKLWTKVFNIDKDSDSFETLSHGPDVPCTVKLVWNNVHHCPTGPGLLIMGGDWHSRGRAFESRHRIQKG